MRERSFVREARKGSAKDAKGKPDEIDFPGPGSVCAFCETLASPAHGGPHRKTTTEVHRPTLMTFLPHTNNDSQRQLHTELLEIDMSIEMIEVEEFNLGTQIKVIGVGGGGGNAV